MNGRAAIGIWLETDHPRVLNDRIWLSNPAGLHGEQADYLLTCTPLNTFGFPELALSIEDLDESLMKGREFTPWDLVGQNAEVALGKMRWGSSPMANKYSLSEVSGIG